MDNQAIIEELGQCGFYPQVAAVARQSNDLGRGTAIGLLTTHHDFAAALQLAKLVGPRLQPTVLARVMDGLLADGIANRQSQC